MVKTSKPSASLIKRLAGTLIWDLSIKLNNHVENEVFCYRNSVLIKDISDNLIWLSGIHIDDWEYGNGFLAIYEEISNKNTWLLSHSERWGAFCEEVALQVDRPVNYGIAVIDTTIEFKSARDRWQALGYAFQYIEPVKGIRGLLNPNAYKLLDATS